MRVSFPGRFGDLLWALPTIRALSERNGAPVDLTIAGEFASIVPLLQLQPYLGEVYADPAWIVSPHAMPPPADLHLGYQGWPELPLPKAIEARLHAQWKDADGPVPVIDLTRPWITPPDYAKMLGSAYAITLGFSETHFELKYGLSMLLWQRFMQQGTVNLSGANERWQKEAGQATYTWETAAAWISQSQVFVGCCSALHVLAVAIGVPVVLVEPMEARHNPVFYPLGTTGRVQLVTGNDGLPTVDARHVGDAIEAVLARRLVGVAEDAHE